MNKDIEQKLNKISHALDTFEEGKPLPISVADIHYIVGAATKLSEMVTRSELAYKADIKKRNEEVEKYKAKYQEARHISCKLTETIHAGRRVIEAATMLSWWRRSKELTSHLESLAEVVRKQGRK